MDVSEQIKRFEQFIEQNYSVELVEAISIGNNHLVLDFARLSKFDPELADLLLDQPEETLKAFEISVKNLDVPDSINRFYMRFKNLPRSQAIKIRNIRSRHIDNLIFAEGIVRQKSDVRPQVTTAKFECPSCGNVLSVIQLESKFKEPSRCGCGRKGKFRLLSKELVDAQKIVLEEISEDLEGGEQPKRMDIFLKNDLVSPLSDKKTNPGTKIRVVGQVKEVPIPSKDGGKLVRFDLMIDSNYVQSIEESFGELTITKEEEKQIIELSKDPKILNKLVNSMAPSIYGHEKVKEAIIMQLLGGVKKVRNDGVVTRGDMHILLVGDPGAGKSQLLKRAQLVAPKSRYVSGKGASGAGLTAAVVKDEFLRGWALEAGALVLSNKGFCMIDEMDKMTKEDREAMHEALEQQTVSISKANIQATLRCETTVLAAANPKWGRFDPYEILGKQIDLPPA
ncbi:minichromosome maintenance protein MCM, partial [Candidatus Woesearchaeota archaeon]|nr:minichromosome maintenance protein MCM [Candidatus Woesearchaeota archaeon]